MDINWDLIKKEIIIETKEVFVKEKILNIDELVDLFFKVLQYPTEDSAINGIENRIPNALNKILVELIPRNDKNSFFPDACKIEPYLRKVLSIVNPSVYETIKCDKKKALSSIITALNLNPNHIDYSWNEIPNNLRSCFSEHLLKAYNVRNLEGHNCTDWTNSKLYDELRSVMVIYLYSTHKHFESLKLNVETNDFRGYLLEQVDHYKIWQKRFVHIEGKENIAEIDLYAKEVFELDEIKNNKMTGISTNPREGKINELRNQIIEKHMILLGDVGMGKTTTLQFLHMNDAETALTDKNAQIPIYIELKNLTSKQDIITMIVKRLNKKRDFILELLNSGKLSICLDGLNEIEKSIKVNIFTQINNLLKEYPKNCFLISSRPQAYNREFDDYVLNVKIPVFMLQRMHDKQISEFLDKNGPTVKAYITNEINNNDKLKRIIQTPLMLIMLIGVVIKEGSIPSEKGKIVKAFMLSLYEREQRQHFEFDKEIFHLFLCYLGFQTRNLTGSNSGLDRDEYILPILEERRTQLGITIDLIDFLRRAIDLNLLIKDENQYSFTHELYQEYYAAEFLHEFRKN